VSAILRAEAIKLRTVRSTWWSLLLFVGVSVLFTAILCGGSTTQGGSPGHGGDNDIILDSLAGVWFGAIALAVLAVLAITSEYSTGMIRTTLAACAQRRTVLAAKGMLVGAVALVLGFAVTATCFTIGQELLHGGGFTYENGYPEVTLADREAFRAVAGTTFLLGAIALFSLGVGAIVRHTAGAITIVLVVLLAPPIAIAFLPERLSEPLEKYSLMGAGLAIQQTVERPDNIPLEPAWGLAVVGAYAAVALLLALWLIGRRDA
jgi:ABC-2 type transport system permease protein